MAEWPDAEGLLNRRLARDKFVVHQVPDLLRLRALLSGLYADLRALDERVRELDKEIRAIGRENEAVGRVQQLRGIGPLIASALVAMIGDARQFKNGRHVAVALGLTPRQHSSGSKERILGISKRGDSYVAHAVDPRRSLGIAYGAW